jgi:hypothetical protein
MEGSYEFMFLQALLLTVAIETAALFLFARLVFRIKRKQASNHLLLFCGVGLSFATLPYVWFVFPAFLSGFAYIAGAELFAFIAEAAGYKLILRTSWKNAALLSFACNASSFLVGLLVF